MWEVETGRRNEVVILREESKIYQGNIVGLSGIIKCSFDICRDAFILFTFYIFY